MGSVSYFAKTLTKISACVAFCKNKYFTLSVVTVSFIYIIAKQNWSKSGWRSIEVVQHSRDVFSA